MSEKPGPIAESFTNIHNIITRGLSTAIDGVQKVTDSQDINAIEHKGLLLYIQALASVLHSHHLTEDEVAFPYFRDKLPGAPFDVLSLEHRGMVKLLEVMNNALAKWEMNDQPDVNLRHLERALITLNDIWIPHIRVEKEDFIVKADALLPMEECVRLVGAFAEHGVKHAIPHPITVPFLLFNLPPPERAAFSQGMPAEVVQHLVPVVWKSQWEAMQPFLLT